jgi:hypothetical protein
LIPSESDAEFLQGLRWKDLRDLAARHGIDVRGLRSKADMASALLSSASASAIRREVKEWTGEGPGADRTLDRLAAIRDAIREAANLGSGIGAAEDAWKAATRALEQGHLKRAEEELDRASQLAAEARERRITEIEASLVIVADHIAAAQKVGADVADAEELRSRALDSVSAHEYTQAGELVKEAERVAIQAQQRQIEQAIRLRERQIDRARAIIAGCEPILQEAESYDINASDVRTLLRQARDVLAKGDYLAGLTFAHNAEEATYRLSSRVEEERKRRGISRPSLGMCGVCGSGHLIFYEDGWGRCSDCNGEFRWRGSLGLRERLRGLLGT